MQDGRDTAQQEYLFALDIGTRSVIGIVGKRENGLFHVVDVEREEHKKRAMFDGQIEDIEQVAKVAGLVKSRLEQRLGTSFSHVCVAAAGRSLRTSRASFEMPLNPDEPVGSQTVYQLEMGAIGLAQDEVNSRDADEEKSMFCVGYSVIGYQLDGYPMTTILGHRGKSVKVEVIATFLPNQVVDSLRSAMNIIHLNIINLTLEPIAAMNAVIPTELRLLNLALVDIGAGTSDIAISDKGSVVAYTMATVAGDEITESVMKRYLVDFAVAENLKAMAAKGNDPICYTDILGFEYTISLEELLATLRPSVEELAGEICKRIVECNGGPPVAIFLVGGGSKVPLLGSAVAKLLGIDSKKVAIGGNNYMKRQTSGELDLSDPEYATPLGIAITASVYAEQNSMCVYVNDQKVHMLRSAGFTVMNALLMCGYKYTQLMGKSGKSLSFRLNGENMLVRGGLPQPAQITVNNKPASIATAVENDDRIIIMPSLSGGDACATVGEFMKTSADQTVTVDGIPFAIGELPFANGLQVSRDYIIQDGDTITTVWIHSLAELCRKEGILTEGRHFTAHDKPVLLNDLLRDGDSMLSADDSYEFCPVSAEKSIFVDEEVIPPPQSPPQGQPIHVTLNRHAIELYPKADGSPYQFLDMLNFVDIDPQKPEGDIVLKLNGQNTSYLQEIHDNDAVQIYWSKREDEFIL
ncbi:MAG: cell division FtsA domain-containing protein [Angelakisella sp.]